MPTEMPEREKSWSVRVPFHQLPFLYRLKLALSVLIGASLIFTVKEPPVEGWWSDEG